MRTTFLVFLFSFSLIGLAQEKSGAQQFWENLQKHCGKSYEGEIKEGPANDDFRDKKLVMQVRSCSENEIRIPFFVGENKSRTWVLTYEKDRILLKHDHRHEDGSEDKVTQYGGKTTNSGTANFQFFPADQETYELIPRAASNIWWVTLDEKVFSYNLRRIGSETVFSVWFDLTKTVENPSVPWGWVDSVN